jgi:hypothetical protein
VMSVSDRSIGLKYPKPIDLAANTSHHEVVGEFTPPLFNTCLCILIFISFSNTDE